MVLLVRYVFIDAQLLWLVLEVDTLHSVADTGQYLVGYGIDNVAEHCHGQVLAENLDLVAFLADYVGAVDHCHVHADVSHVLRFLSVYQTVAMTVAKVAVQTVGIAYGYGADNAVALQHRASAVTNAIASLDVSQLEYGGLQCRDIVNCLVVARIHTIEPKSQTAHVQLALREVLDACRIVNMA